MSAGSGIRHSEFNPSETEPVHLYQIWLLPREKGLPPSYEQKPFDPAARQGQWQLVASPDGASGSLTIQQDARIYLANLSAGDELKYSLVPGRHAWLQVIAGSGTLNGSEITTSDGAAVSEERELNLSAASPLEVMLFDLP
jgi:redox-sensitive bicupin YhaK (pirin superfamily)